MPGDFHVQSQGGVVIVVSEGALEFDDTNRAIKAAVERARSENSKRVIFDLRRADVANYYSYTVRHAEVAPEIGLDTSYRIGFVGNRDAADVLYFGERVARNRGWTARAFFDMAEALRWINQPGS